MPVAMQQSESVQKCNSAVGKNGRLPGDDWKSSRKTPHKLLDYNGIILAYHGMTFGIPMKSGSVIELPAARSVTTAGKRLIRGVNGRNGSQAKPLKKLTEKEEKNLQRYEAVICGHGDKFVEVGLALWSIREEELYLKTHTTFEAYCQDKFDFTANYGGRLLRSAEAVN